MVDRPRPLGSQPHWEIPRPGLFLHVHSISCRIAVKALALEIGKGGPNRVQAEKERVCEIRKLLDYPTNCFALLCSSGIQAGYAS